MKNVIRSGALIFVFFYYISCNINKVNSEIDKVGEKEYIGETEDFVKVEPISVEGKVKKTNKGKDGYTAELVAKDNTLYYITISMTNTVRFKSVKIGDFIKVKGDLWKIEGDNYVIVKELKIE